MCPADGFFPSVGEGELSLSICPGGFVGYSYRLCRNGVLGDVRLDKCEYKPPSGLAYVISSMECMVDEEVTSGVPTYTGFVTEFYMEGEASLPEGLVFNSTTGEIRGVPRTTSMRQFTVCVKNPAGEACTEITITVQNAYCAAADGFERTKVGEMAVYECSEHGYASGKRRRMCVMGEKKGEWQKANGFCMPKYLLVLLIVLGVLVLIVIDMIMVVAYIFKRSRMAKPAGGVKRRRSLASRRVQRRSKLTKAVKV